MNKSVPKPPVNKFKITPAIPESSFFIFSILSPRK